MVRRRVVVSGMGATSPFGIGSDTFWRSIVSGTSGARLIETFDASHLPVRFAASCPLSETELDAHVTNQKTLKTLSRSGKMAVIAAQEALADSGLDLLSLEPLRTGTSIGAGGVGYWDNEHFTQLLDVFLDSVEVRNGKSLDHSRVWENILNRIHPLTPLRNLSNVPTAQIAILANARGNSQTITTACTSGAQAIGEAFRQVGSGIADVMICGGADSMINPYGLVAFSMVGVLSTNNDEWQTASRPFDRRRDGFMVGEGSAIFILEEYEHCRRRGGRILGEVIGYASTNDAYRLTDEPPEAWGSIAAMRSAIQDAGIGAMDIDYINAHGTGTPMNDRTETFAIKAVLGDHAYRTPVSSTKSMVGHLVAAAGAIEFAATIMALKHGFIPPTINYSQPDDACDLDYVPNKARTADLNVVISNSFGFGGQNACLVIRKCDDG